MRELQVLAAELAGKDGKVVEAKLLKADFGTNAFLGAMASTPRKRDRDGRPPAASFAPALQASQTGPVRGSILTFVVTFAVAAVRLR